MTIRLRIHFLFYLLIGAGWGAACLFLPRWHTWDRLWRGAGNWVPVLLGTLVLAGACSVVDVSPWPTTSLKLGLLVAAQVITVAAVFSLMRIGF